MIKSKKSIYTTHADDYRYWRHWPGEQHRTMLRKTQKSAKKSWIIHNCLSTRMHHPRYICLSFFLPEYVKKWQNTNRPTLLVLIRREVDESKMRHTRDMGYGIWSLITTTTTTLLLHCILFGLRKNIYT